MGWRQYDKLSDEVKNAVFKATLAPVFRRINSSRFLNKSGMLPKRIVICGAPRSGTTLMNELMRCFHDTYVMYREERALRFPYLGVREKYVVTKHPLDFNYLDEVIKKFDRPFIIFMLRDPRDVVISKHYKSKDHYLVNYPLWEKASRAFENLEYDNKILVRYEDLTKNPESVQQLIIARLQLELKSDFRDFFKRVDPRHQDIKSLGGVRPIDSSNSRKYLKKEHFERIREQISKYPEMSDRLIEYGYEQDRSWEVPFRANE